MAACCYFGVDLRNQLDNKFHFHLMDGILHSSSDLLSASLFLPFTWTNYSESNSLSPFFSWINYFQSNPSFLISSSEKYLLSLIFFSSLCFSRVKISKPSSKFLKKGQDNSVFCLSCKFNPVLQKCSTPNFLSDLQKFPFSPTYSIILPLESTPCPLTPLFVLACADSVEERRFRS